MKILRRILKMSPWTAAALGFLLLAFSVTDQSIDMDEAQTWDYTRLASLSEVWTELRTDNNSESQMPLGMMAMWGWAKVFGTGELATRSLNLVWAALALVALALVGRQTGISWLPLLLAIQPFLWYSMDQARTPMMQMAGGAMLLAGTIKLINGSQRWILTALLLSLGSVILCGASMLGVVPLMVVIGFLVASAAWKRILFSRASKVCLFVTVGLLGILGLYYLSTLYRGAGGTRLWNVGFSNLLFVAYEFLGLSGLGPGRQELRAIMRGAAGCACLGFYLLGWGVLVSAYALVFLAAFKSWMTRAECQPRKPSFRIWVLCAAVPTLGALLLFCLATAVGFPFWGRHLAGTLPFAVTAIGIALYWSTQGLWRKCGRVGAVLTILMLVASCALIRLSPRHRHDDYQAAAAAAKTLSANGRVVWWVADHSGGEYYGLEYVKEGPGVWHAPNLNMAPSFSPDVIIISRPENFDNSGTAGRIARAGGYRRTAVFQAFEIWEK